MRQLPSELCSLVYRLREGGCSYARMAACLRKILPDRGNQQRVAAETLVCVYISERDRQQGLVTIRTASKIIE